MPASFSSSRRRHRVAAHAALALAAGALCAGLGAQTPAPAQAPGACQPIHLVLDTSNLEITPMLMEALHYQKARVTIFSANEMQKNGHNTLSREWGQWWRTRGREGHDVAPRTWDRVEWRADLTMGRDPRFRMFIHDGALAGREFTWKGKQYCDSLNTTAMRLKYHAGKVPLKLFHAEGPQISERLLKVVQACGYKHVAWIPATFLTGKDWMDGKKSYADLTRQALQTLPPHPVLLVGSGMWEGVDGWVVGGVLKQFVSQAQAQGYCFKPLSEHPDYRQWLQEHPYKEGQ